MPANPREVPEAEKAFEDLQRWMQSGHKGYKCRLESREIPGAGRGLFAAEDIPAGETILEIPSSALINPLTLASTSTIPDHLFPLCTNPPPAKKAKTTRSSLPSTSSRLNTTQLLTLYLALTKDPKNRHSSPWTAYLATLPRSFRPWHPLTWYYREGDEGWWQKLIGYMPISARRKLEEVKGRYEVDLEVLKRVLIEESPFEAQALYPKSISDDTLLWAWLNVNTRTVSVPLDLGGPSSLQNHSLVPILDLINHSSREDQKIPTPIQYQSTPSGGPGSSTRGQPAHLIPGKIGFRLIAPERGLKIGQEVKFEYGGHSSETLFTEYGFCPEEKTGDWLGLVYGECDVNDVVETMFPIGSEKVRTKLEELGCWGANKLYTHPKPAHASHGLIMTLRLYHLNAKKNKKNTKNLADNSSDIDPYADGCEGDIRNSLIDLCREVISETDQAHFHIGFFIVDSMKHRQPECERGKKNTSLDWLLSENNEGDREYFEAMDNMRLLWYERAAIAKKVKTGIAAGQKIWD